MKPIKAWAIRNGGKIVCDYEPLEDFRYWIMARKPDEDFYLQPGDKVIRVEIREVKK